MINSTKENLKSLSKEQLVKIIEDLNHCNFLIVETLVDESKCHITSSKCINNIREYLSEYTDRYNFCDKNLSSYVDFELGKITANELKRIVLGEC